MKVLEYKDRSVKVAAVKELIQSAGNQIFAVTFIKRSDGTKRKMSCRRKVRKPSYAKAPTGQVSFKRRDQDDKNNLMTVFDCNCLKYNRQDRLNGRGGWKSLPLDSVTRLKINGEVYKII
jgi:hypothetical protein